MFQRYHREKAISLFKERQVKRLHMEFVGRPSHLRTQIGVCFPSKKNYRYQKDHPISLVYGTHVKVMLSKAARGYKSRWKSYKKLIMGSENAKLTFRCFG